MIPLLPTKENETDKPLTIFKIVSVAVILNIIIIGLATITIVQSYYLHEKESATESHNLVEVIQQECNGLIDTVDMALFQVKDEAERQLADQGLNYKMLDKYIDQVHKRVIRLSYLRMADAQGNIILGYENSEQRKANIIDRDYFKQHSMDANAGLTISKPIISRA